MPLYDGGGGSSGGGGLVGGGEHPGGTPIGQAMTVLLASGATGSGKSHLQRIARALSSSNRQHRMFRRIIW
jgi:hypothetical protein